MISGILSAVSQREFRTGEQIVERGRISLGSTGGSVPFSKILFQRADARQVVEDFLNEVNP